MNRDNTIDIIKGVAILSVIVGHLTHFWALRGMIYTFHMPVFFFASGYFFKKKLPYELMKSLSRSLLLPYLFTSIVLNINYLNKHIGGGGFVARNFVCRWLYKRCADMWQPTDNWYAMVFACFVLVQDNL